MSLEVLASVTDERAVSLDFWTSVPEDEAAVVLYASLASHRGQLPVRNAKVKQSFERVFYPFSSIRLFDTHLNRDKIEANMSVPGVQGCHENAIYKSFEAPTLYV